VELTPLRYFKAIAEARHMTRAAEALGVTQPALSAMLKKLETEVGTPLFHRTGRGVALTEAGEAFLAYAEEALRATDAGVKAVRQLVGLETGSIRIGGGATATTYLLPPVVSAFREKHPALRFYVREAGSSAVAAAVISGELDLGIVTVPFKGKWSLPGAADLLSIPLVEDELKLIVPPAKRTSPERERRFVRPGFARPDDGDTRPRSPIFDPASKAFRWKDLSGIPFVSFEAGTAVRELIDSAAKASGVTLDVVMELRSIESIKSMVAAGIGVGLVSRFALDGTGLPCRDGKLSRMLAIVRRRDRIPSRAAGEFERMLIAALA
jgi:DNA-binding transcriptional LysR family regulator